MDTVSPLAAVIVAPVMVIDELGAVIETVLDELVTVVLARFSWLPPVALMTTSEPDTDDGMAVLPSAARPAPKVRAPAVVMLASPEAETWEPMIVTEVPVRVTLAPVDTAEPLRPAPYWMTRAPPGVSVVAPAALTPPPVRVMLEPEVISALPPVELAVPFWISSEPPAAMLSAAQLPAHHRFCVVASAPVDPKVELMKLRLPGLEICRIGLAALNPVKVSVPVAPVNTNALTRVTEYVSAPPLSVKPLAIVVPDSASPEIGSAKKMTSLPPVWPITLEEP